MIDAERQDAMPERLVKRPRDRLGRVIPWTLGHRDGQPMMGTNDSQRVARAILERRCGLCGEPLDYWVAFLGDDETVRRRVFIEPPMHEDCARYAIEVCPYIRAEPGFEVRRERMGVLAVADRARPERMALYITRGLEPFFGTDIPAAKAAAAKRIEWLSGSESR